MPGTGAGRSSSISPRPWHRCRSARRRPITSCSSWSTRRSFLLPALKRPDDAVRLQLPPRHALLAGDTDVLVVGGGPAGVGAAGAAPPAGAPGGPSGGDRLFRRQIPPPPPPPPPSLPT